MIDMTFKQIMDVGLPLAAATGTIYGMEVSGITDWLINLEIYNKSFFGSAQWVKDIYEFSRPLGHFAYDLGAGATACAAAFYLIDLASRRLRK